MRSRRGLRLRPPAVSTMVAVLAALGIACVLIARLDATPPAIAAMIEFCLLAIVQGWLCLILSKAADEVDDEHFAELILVAAGAEEP